MPQQENAGEGLLIIMTDLTWAIREDKETMPQEVVGSRRMEDGAQHSQVQSLKWISRQASSAG
jgi:hypothetical protein